MRSKLLILVTAIAGYAWSCSDDTAAPPAPGLAGDTGMPQNNWPSGNANPCPPVGNSTFNNNITSTTLAGGFGATTTTLAGSGGGGFNDPNRFGLVSTTTTLMNNGMNNGFSNGGANNNAFSNGGVTPTTMFGGSTNCPPTGNNPNINSGNQSYDNQQLNNFFNPPELVACNGRGKVYHWYKNGEAVCLEDINYEPGWCNDGAFASEFGSNSSAVTSWRQGLSSEYKIKQCGKGRNNTVYVSFIKETITDSGANIVSSWQCGGDSSVCPPRDR